MNIPARDSISLQPSYMVTDSAWLEHGPFAIWLMEQLKPRTVVELGSHKGYSYFCFCQVVLKLNLDTKCFAIDTWQSDEHAGFYQNDIFNAVTDQNKPYNAFSTLIRARFDEALSHFEDGTVDLLHIDGRHFYDDVKEDFESWVPKLTRNAIVLFHDTQVRENNFGVLKFFGELKTQYRTFEFEHGHGLGVLAMGEVPESINILFSNNNNQIEKTRNYFRILGKRLKKSQKLNKFSVYRLHSIKSSDFKAVLQLRYYNEDGEQIAYLPNRTNASWLLVPDILGRSAKIKSDDVKIEPLALWPSLKARAQAWLTFRRKKYLKFDRFTLLFSGPKASRLLAISTNRLLTRTGTRPDSAQAQKHPEFLIGWGPDRVTLQPCVSPRSLPVKIAIALHVYYDETWPELAEILRHFPYAHDLIVTTSPAKTALAAQIQAEFPEAQVRIVENRGRDIGPFLTLLEDGTFASYDYICKIHSKKSQANDPSGNLGDICRRRAFFDLLVAPDTVKTIIDRFKANPQVGMIGSRVFRLRGAAHRKIFWRSNKVHMNRIIEELGGKAENIEPDFFEGTMFWVRTKAFDSLRQLKLSTQLKQEQGMKDGALEHAVERIFATSVTLAGYVIEDIDALTRT